MPTYSNLKVVWMPSATWQVLAALAVMFSMFIFNCSAASAADFTDVSGHWAETAIEQAVSAGYVQGYPDGTFRPDDVVTRAEFVTMLDSAFQVPDDSYANPGDVSDQDWFAQDVESALAAGYVSDYPDGTFRPQDGESRQDAASMLAKLLKLNSNGDLSFADAGQIDSSAVPYVSGLVAAGIFTGYPDNTFRPQETITRAEAVVIVNNALAMAETTSVNGQLQVTGDTDVVNVRSGPNMNAQIIGQVNTGDILQAQAKNEDDWYRIEYQGGSGWIAGWYVQDYQLSVTGNSGQTGSTANEPAAKGAQATSSPASTGTQTTNSLPANQTQNNSQGANAAVLDNSPAAGGSLASLQYGQNDAGSSSGIQDGATQDVGSTGAQAPENQASSSAGISAPGGSSTVNNGTSFYGIDMAAYPGDDVMQTWWNDSPFNYVGFYLGPAPYHPDTSFMDKRQVLIDQGWGLLPVYVGRQADSSYLDPDDGTLDGDDAANLAASAGFPAKTAIYLDIETWSPLSDSFMSYVNAWVNEVESRGYVAGIYCYVANASQLAGALPSNVQFWIAYYVENGMPLSIPSPTDSGVSFANVWQFIGDTTLTYGGITLDVDVNTSDYTDPSLQTVDAKK
jgi:uncharacterized protein YgiM (DUF1202 family)